MFSAKPFPNPVNSFPFQITSIQNPRKYNVQQNINLGSDQSLPSFSVKSKSQANNLSLASNIPSLNNSSLPPPQPPNKMRRNLSPRNNNYRVNSKVYSALTWQNEADTPTLPSYTIKPINQGQLEKMYSKQPTQQMAQFHPSIVDGTFDMLKEDQT